MYTRDTARDLRDALTALKPSSRRLRHINLDTFFNWCVREKLIRESPMATLDLPPNGDATTGVFEPDEYQRVLDACDRFDLTGNRNTIRTGRRLRAFTELLRWSGLRVSDVVRLERKALTWDKTSETWGINLRQKKTKNHVACAIPPHVAELVQSAAPVPGSKDYNPAYFFWDGKSDPDTVASLWGNAFSTVCGRADLREADGSKKRCHPHMLRDTFAVEALIAKVGIHVVSKRLGHKSITTTEQAYMPFVARRAASDTQQIKDSWATQGLPSTPPKPALKIVPKKKASGG
jgi:integrase